jgi:hypothetical protein
MVGPPTNNTGPDRRGSPRISCSLDGLAVPGSYFCTLVDRSETGVKLRFQRNYHGPKNFVVILLASGQALAVSVKWSKGVEVGALITARCDLNGLVPSTFADARQVWGKLKASGAPVAAAGQPVWPISLSRP